MSNFNKVILLGNLTRDPEVRFTREGAPVASFRVRSIATVPVRKLTQRMMFPTLISSLLVNRRIL